MASPAPATHHPPPRQHLHLPHALHTNRRGRAGESFIPVTGLAGPGLMKTMVRACIRPGKRDDLKDAVQRGDCPPTLRKAFDKGRYEGDICYFTVGSVFGDPWAELKPWVETYFEIEWERSAKAVEPEEVQRIGKLHTMRAKLGLGQ